MIFLYSHCLLLFAIEAGDLLNSVKIKKAKYAFLRRLCRISYILLQTFYFCQALSFSSLAFDTLIINSVPATESRANFIFVKYA